MTPKKYYKRQVQAAGSQWNFLPFRPGLVGGHCLGVDPHYLTHKAQAIGYNPEIILAGRRINEAMAADISKAQALLGFAPEYPNQPELNKAKQDTSKK